LAQVCGLSFGATAGVLTGARDDVDGVASAFVGLERWRRFSREQKQAVVPAAFAPKAVDADVARRADVGASLI